MSGVTEAANRERAAAVEAEVVDRLDLVPYADGEEFDAMTRPTPDGTPVEVKSTVYRYDSGRHGRFCFGRRQHERLKDRDGVYALTVVDEDTGEVDFERSGYVDPEAVDEIGNSWTDTGAAHTSHEQQMQVPVSKLLGDMTEDYEGGAG